VTLYGKGEAVGMNYYDTESYGGGRKYLGKDVMGSVWGVTDDYGILGDRYEYDIFGEAYEGDLGGGMNLGYTGKPYDVVTGMYNYGYRDYAPGVARFTTEDPIRDGNNWYAYVNNDPVNWVDLWGLKPGDIFPTVDEAADDFGKEFNGISIIKRIEYGTTIIQTGNGYSYMEPTEGDDDEIILPIPLDGPDQAVAGHHTHANYDARFVVNGIDYSNLFSFQDKETARLYGKPFYLAAPDGSLSVYDPITDSVRLVNTNMPSDPNNPNRRNNIDPSLNTDHRKGD
jgi:RHS repeat-associated protein